MLNEKIKATVEGRIQCSIYVKNTACKTLFFRIGEILFSFTKGLCNMEKCVLCITWQKIIYDYSYRKAST